MSTDIIFKAIGVVHSPFTDAVGMPIQPAAADGVEGSVEVFAEYAEGLRDLDGFSHVILLYHFHRAGDVRLVVTPFLDTEPRGVFATRAPSRPNAIGLSVVRLLGVEGNVLCVQGVDVLDGTPLLDVKPYVPEFDRETKVRIGWLQGRAKGARERKSDDRFE
jgi:tRNA-Thr(GGU) m(6)t(6)A37 methyltransferase TsaA